MNLKPSAAAIALLATCVLIQQARCQQPHPPRMTKTDWVLLTAQAGMRVDDTLVTRKNLNTGGREWILPNFIAGHTRTMATYSEGAVIGDWWLASQLRKHRQPKLATLYLALDLGQDTTETLYSHLSRPPKVKP